MKLAIYQNLSASYLKYLDFENCKKICDEALIINPKST